MVGMNDTLENVLGAGTFDADGKASFTINGATFNILKTDTVSSLMSQVNSSEQADVKMEYSEFTNSFSMSRKSSGVGYDFTIEDEKNVLSQLFGSTGTMDEVLANDKMYSAGQNAKVTINGIATERSNNTFTIDGLNFELLATTKTEETVTTTRNTEAIFDGVMSFVDEYNKLIEELDGLISGDEDYKEYPPLTDAQRKEMSKSEIDAWEKKAKTGLMHGDQDIQSALSQLRVALYQKPDGAALSLFDFGIETSSDWKEKGKLVVDETKLKEMINSNSADLEKLFTHSKTKVVDGKTVPDGTQGIATTFNNILNQMANKSSGSQGTLVRIAGVEGTASEDSNTISDQMVTMNDRIKALKIQFETEKTRYWREFNNMEQVLAGLSSQSAWLTQQTTTGM